MIIDYMKQTIKLITLSMMLSPLLVAGSGPAGATDQLAMSDYLERAIQRGVPLFNQGQPAACAAVYATALEAVAGGAGGSIDEQQREHLDYALAMAATIDDPVDQAWAYRALIDTLLRGEPLAAPANPDTRILFDFSDTSDIDRWGVVLDGVMGGLSTGKIEKRADALAFSGQTSLRNNGGFSSMRAPVPAGSLAGYDALRIRLKGDGRTWIVGASRGDARGESYWARLETRDGAWQTVTVPIAAMERQHAAGQYFGRPIGGRIQPSAIRGLEFYIYDKKAGPFELEIEQVEAVSTR